MLSYLFYRGCNIKLWWEIGHFVEPAIFVLQIGTLEGYFHLEHPSHPQRSRRSAEDRTDQLLGTPGVSWAEQQHEKVRVKRGYFHDRMVARGVVPRFRDPLWDAQWYLVRIFYRFFFSVHTPHRFPCISTPIMVY